MNKIYFIRFEDSDNVGMYRSTQLEYDDNIHTHEYLYDDTNYHNQCSFLDDTELCTKFSVLVDNNPTKNIKISNYNFGFTKFSQMINWFRNQSRFNDFLIMLDLIGKIKFNIYFVEIENTVSSNVQSITDKYEKIHVISIPPIVVYTFFQNFEDLYSVSFEVIISKLIDFTLEYQLSNPEYF